MAIISFSPWRSQSAFLFSPPPLSDPAAGWCRRPSVVTGRPERLGLGMLRALTLPIVLLKLRFGSESVCGCHGHGPIDAPVGTRNKPGGAAAGLSQCRDKLNIS